MKAAIIIPYRNREHHLHVFKSYMNNILPIYVIEQADNALFNRGKLLNIGFDMLQREYTHFFFHDVDMLPISFNDYKQPFECAHLAYSVSQFDYKPLGQNYFGGVNLFSRDCFNQINGFSNQFYGWGGEDNELLKRCKLNHIEPIYLPGVYVSLQHKSNRTDQIYNSNMRKFRRADAFNMSADGLNSLRYAVISNESNHIKVIL